MSVFAKERKFWILGFVLSVHINIAVITVAVVVIFHPHLQPLSLAIQSVICKKMASRVAFWVDRHVGPKFTVFVWEFDGKQFP